MSFSGSLQQHQLEAVEMMKKYYEEIFIDLRGKVGRGFDAKFEYHETTKTIREGIVGIVQYLTDFTLEMKCDTKFYKKVFDYVRRISHDDDCGDYDLYRYDHSTIVEEKAVKVNNQLKIDIITRFDVLNSKTTFIFSIEDI